MSSIQRHDYPNHQGTNRFWERNQQKLANIKTVLNGDVPNFESRFSRSRQQIGLGLGLDKQHSDTCAWMHLGCELCVGLFKATRHHGAETSINVEIAGSNVEVPTKKTRYGTPDIWLQGLAIALALRYKTAIDSLATHNPHGSYETHTAIWGDALIIWLTDDQDPSELLEVAAGYTEEAEYQRDLGVKVHKPLILATQAIYDEDADRFNECLAEALRGHRAVLGTGEAANSPANLLSFEALGLCSLAYDRGLPIEVESGYIPKWIYEGGCKERPDLQAYVKEVSGA